MVGACGAPSPCPTAFIDEERCMLKKAREQAKSAGADEAKDLGRTVLESSRQIWLAGLGAFSRAQAEGMKMFETLVEQGQNLESRTKRAASQTAAAAAGAAAQKAKEMQAMAGGTWDKLEQVFEDRVARALGKLGVYTQNDVARLAERVDALSEAVNALIKAGGGSTRTVASGKRTAAPRKRAGKGAVASTERGPQPTGSSEPEPAQPARTPRKSAKRRGAKSAHREAGAKSA
jgi:poly(hydroxyalkanoate) granule-associated protein